MSNAGTSGHKSYEERVKAIPELSHYPKEVVKKYIRVFGFFKYPDRLDEKEKRFLHRHTKKFNRHERYREKNEITKKLFKKKKQQKVFKTTMDSSKCKQRVIIDLSYLEEIDMKYSDLKRCSLEAKRCYSINRALSEPLQLHFTGIKDIVLKTFQNLFGSEYKSWDVFLHEDFYHNLFDKKDIVYLTSDSENILDSLDDSKVYVIGGILDHKNMQGLSYSKATKENISHARLPIDKYTDLKKSLQVLNTSEVFSIIASVANNVPWDKALKDNIPSWKSKKQEED